jgi:hypothetical protein
MPLPEENWVGAISPRRAVSVGAITCFAAIVLANSSSSKDRLPQNVANSHAGG